MRFLPERLALLPSFVAARLAVALAPSLLLATLGLAALALSVEDVARLVSQEDIARDGHRAEHASIDIERDASLFVFRARHYEVRFEDAEGLSHSARVREHDVALGPLVVEGPPELHYDPTDARRVSIGFARQNVPAQWAAVTLLLAVAAIFLALAIATFAKLSASLRAARAACRRGVERAARVVSVERSLDSSGAPTGEQHLVLALEAPHAERLDSYRAHGASHATTSPAVGVSFEVVTSAADPPLFLDTLGERVLVVVAPGVPPTLVRRSGHPFALSPDARRALLGRVPPQPAAAASSAGASAAAPPTAASRA